MSAAAPLAANPGPAVHLALLGVVVLVGLVVFAVVHRRHRREAAETEKLDSTPGEGTGVPDDR